MGCGVVLGRARVEDGGLRGAAMRSEKIIETLQTLLDCIMEGGRDAIEGAKSVLRTLKELLEDGLISKHEYDQQEEKEVQQLLLHARKQGHGAKTTELEATSTGREGTNTAAMVTEAEGSRSTRLAEVARQEGEGRSSKKEVEVVARSEARPNVRRDDRGTITITRTTTRRDGSGGGGVSDEGKRRREEYERRRREEEREVIGGREKRRRERSRESWDDVGRVEVWRLPKTINPGGVKAMFRGVGTVTEAVVHTQDGSPKARATVTFADSSQAERAVRTMHGKLIEGIGNIGVKMLAPENGGVRRSPSPPKKPSGRSPTKERDSYAPAGPPSRNDSRYDWGGYSWYDYDPRDPRSDSRDPRRDLRFSRDPRYDWRKDSRYR